MMKSTKTVDGRLYLTIRIYKLFPLKDTIYKFIYEGYNS